VLAAPPRQIVETIKLEISAVSQDLIQPVGVVIDKLRQKAYVALGPANRVAVINAQTLEIEKYFLVGQRVWNLAFSPDENRLYTTNGLSSDVSIIDLQKQQVTKSVAVGRHPWGVAVKP
jgi:YVTN family beta-propeller protein